jgi:hypothetical protein
MSRHLHRISRLLRYRLTLAGFVVLLAAGNVSARTLEVGPDKEYKLPSAAAATAGNGDVVRIDAGNYVDCAVWTQNDIVIEGIGPDASAVIADKVCQGKALFVVRGQNVTVRNLTLRHARAPDMNGAGIRQEAGALVVEHVVFLDNQNGILASDNSRTLIVRDSAFIRNGSCEGACAHGIYAGEMELLRVERSRFLETRHAHHIKSRAARTEVIDSTIADGDAGTASYLIEIPIGGDVLIRGNSLQKGPNAENQTCMIAIGTSGAHQPTHEIVIEHNTARNTGDYNTFFLWNRTATVATLKDNKLSGRIQPLRVDSPAR